MTTSVSSLSPIALVARPATRAQTSQVPLEQNAIDTQLRGQMIVLQGPLNNCSDAGQRQLQAIQRYLAQQNQTRQYCAGLAAQFGLASPPSGAGPVAVDLMAHPDVLEDLKRQRERESRLAGELLDAMDNHDRRGTHLLRALGFLAFGETRDDRSAADERPLINPADKDASGLVWNSHSEFYEMIGVLLKALQQNWLSKYQDAMGKFLEFYEDFQDAMDKLKVSPGYGDFDVYLNFEDMREALDALLKKWGGNGEALAEFSSEAAAKEFIKSLGLPGLKAHTENGVTYVKMDLAAVDDIRKSIKPSEHADPDVHTWTTAEYNAWVSAKDGNVEQIKHVSKVLGEKLSEMTQKFDNIVKILSSTIDKITEADRSFINGL